MGWSRANLRLLYQFWGHLIWAPKFKKGRKRKTNTLHKNKKLLAVTLSSKFNIESKHINTVNWTKSYHSTLKILPLAANYGDTSDWPLTLHNSTNAQIRALDQSLYAFICVENFAVAAVLLYIQLCDSSVKLSYFTRYHPCHGLAWLLGF